jgi:hypothetical protein
MPTARTWLIENYLAGNLTANQRQQVEQRRENDPDFDRAVLAQWLVQLHLEEQQDEAAFDRQRNTLNAELAQQPRRNDTSRTPRYLWQVVMPSLAAAAVLLLVWLSWPPDQLATSVSISEEVGGMPFDGPPVQVVRFAYEPGLLGRLRTQPRYRWPRDTLYLYGKDWQQTTPDQWTLEPLKDTLHYQLTVGERTYELLKGTPELTTPPTR